MEGDLLELDARKRIYGYVAKHPGAYLREMERELGLSQGQLNYHLDLLEKRGLLVSEKEAYTKRYFIHGGEGYAYRKIVPVLKPRATRSLIVEILRAGWITHGELAERVRLSSSTVTYHAKRLVEKEVVERTRAYGLVYYRVRDPEAVVDALTAIRESLMDAAVDRFLAGWANLDARHVRAEAPPPPAGPAYAPASADAPAPTGAAPAAEGQGQMQRGLVHLLFAKL
ncbi:MAG TPA: winged helix-turn-helix transcriptional regulator [Candidatus Thermoplasmatota archaeon]|nr:winged helix-turn-helix transcriptional regulator [Candidatus Thermoplasmatota archaeon]